MRKEFLVIFGKSKHWTYRFLHKEISHVTVISLQGNQWIALDPTPYGLNVESKIYNNETIAMIRKWTDHRVLQVSVNQRENYFAKFGIMTCVDVAQYILGIKLGWCITPYQLYKKLLRCDTSKIYVKIIR